MTREERANAAAHELFFQAQVGPGEGIADAAERIAAAMLTFADDEAAAMRERAAKVAEEWAKENRAAEDQERRIGSASMADRLAGAAIEANALAAAIRALSTRGEG